MNNKENSLYTFNSELRILLNRGEVIKLKTTSGETIYMDITGMDAEEIRNIRNSKLELIKGKINITSKK